MLVSNKCTREIHIEAEVEDHQEEAIEAITPEDEVLDQEVVVEDQTQIQTKKRKKTNEWKTYYFEFKTQLKKTIVFY